MTPAARLATAIELLAQVDAEDAPAERTLARALRARRYVGAKDRRAIGEAVYGVLRARARLDWWCARAGTPTQDGPGASRQRLLAHLVLSGRRSLEDIGATFDGATYHPAPLRAEETALVRALAGQTLEHDEQEPWVRAECPRWLWPAFVRAFGAAAEAELAALGGEATLDLRVNSLKGTREAARAALAEDGIATRPTPHSPLGLRVAGRANLKACRAFASGLVEVQDEGSQLVALLTDARPGMVVLDFCAGAGGKTLALAAAMGGKGRLFALDIDRRRLDRATLRLTRAGADNVVVHRLKGAGTEAAPDEDWLARRAGSCERVLLDVPCSGSGAWRRQPDARWRLTPEALSAYEAAQAHILAQAAPLVAGGGRLVYATCSLLPSENEAPVEAFLAARPEFEVVAMHRVWAKAVAAQGGPADTEPAPFHEPYLRLTPARHGTDGFFAAVLQRRRRA